MKLQTRAGAIFDHTLNILAILAGILIILSTLTVTFEIVVRKLGHPQIWVVPMNEIWLLYIPFLGAAWLLRKEGHVVIDIAITRLKPGVQAWVNAITSIICAIVLLVLTWYGAQVTLSQLQEGRLTGSVGVWTIPTAPVTAVIPVGCFLFSIQFLRRASQHLLMRKRPLKPEVAIKEDLEL